MTTSIPPPVVTTNLLALPLVDLIVQTGNSEDWIESILYVVETADTPDLYPQCDLRGIDFNMEVRRNTPAHEVVLRASTADGTIAIGEPPDFGYLVLNVGYDAMSMLSAGPYVADIRGTDERYTRICIQIDLTIFDGITR